MRCTRLGYKCTPQLRGPGRPKKHLAGKMPPVSVHRKRRASPGEDAAYKKKKQQRAGARALVAAGEGPQNCDIPGAGFHPQHGAAAAAAKYPQGLAFMGAGDAFRANIPQGVANAHAARAANASLAGTEPAADESSAP